MSMASHRNLCGALLGERLGNVMQGCIVKIAEKGKEGKYLTVWAVVMGTDENIKGQLVPNGKLSFKI